MADVKIVSYDHYGEITFSIDGKRYTYLIDPVYIRNYGTDPPFKAWMEHAPKKALNFAKQKGKLIHPKPKPPPFRYEKPEGSCPNCGSQTHAEGVPCPTCGYNESFSFKKWFYES